MAGLGYDLGAHASRSLDGIDGEFDAVITMGCRDSCPRVSAKPREDRGLPGPRDMDDGGYRAVRDEIGAPARAPLESLQEARGGRRRDLHAWPGWPSTGCSPSSSASRCCWRPWLRGHGRGAGRRQRRWGWGTGCSPARARCCRGQGTLSSAAMEPGPDPRFRGCLLPSNAGHFAIMPMASFHGGP